MGDTFTRPTLTGKAKIYAETCMPCMEGPMYRLRGGCKNCNVMDQYIEVDKRKELEHKYIVLKLQNQFDIVVLRNMLNDLIGSDNSLGIAMKWLDIAEILFESELKKTSQIAPGTPST